MPASGAYVGKWRNANLICISENQNRFLFFCGHAAGKLVKQNLKGKDGTAAEEMQDWLTEIAEGKASESLHMESWSWRWKFGLLIVFVGSDISILTLERKSRVILFRCYWLWYIELCFLSNLKNSNGKKKILILILVQVNVYWCNTVVVKKLYSYPFHKIYFVLF